MRRVISVALTLVLATCTSAEPALALGSEHACCFARVAAAKQEVSCHGHPGTQSASISEAHPAHSECFNRCCLGMASRAAQPASSLSSAVARHSAANVHISEFQPFSQAELPAPSGRAPPFRLFC